MLETRIPVQGFCINILHRLDGTGCDVICLCAFACVCVCQRRVRYRIAVTVHSRVQCSRSRIAILSLNSLRANPQHSPETSAIQPPFCRIPCRLRFLILGCLLDQRALSMLCWTSGKVFTHKSSWQFSPLSTSISAFDDVLARLTF